jgi:hypothetical protein
MILLRLVTSSSRKSPRSLLLDLPVGYNSSYYLVACSVALESDGFSGGTVLGASSIVGIGRISRLRTSDPGAESAGSIAEELETAATVGAVGAKMDELESTAAENSVNWRSRRSLIASWIASVAAVNSVRCLSRYCEERLI